ncbi:related to GS1 protein [Hanseniaspora guilliermondii]|uniref:Related to GS1 protein n=1 Tax=Hanseniaspora guilliermondii TaxID=56406 RepID=A0A1L0B8I2_9ASCO|nr:related to GS1 protein [Hanseniaspora guilliermondii]
MEEKRVIKCCLFDMDGLLINTEDIYTLSTTKLLAEYGMPAMDWDFKLQVMGLPGPEVFKKFVQYYDLEGKITYEEYAQKQHYYQEKAWSQCDYLPGVEEFLRYLMEEKNIPCAICTSSDNKKFQLKTQNNMKRDGILDKFVHIIKGDDPRLANGLGKPHPRIYELGLEGINERLGLDIKPEETLVFEDAINGCIAGKAFGGTVCWIPHTEIFGKKEIPEFETLFDNKDQGFVLQSMDKFPKDKFDFQNI